MRIGNNVKEVHLFDEEYTTKRGEKTAENQDGDEWEGINGTTVGSKNDLSACNAQAGEAMVNPCCREIDKRKQAVDLKVTGEVSSPGRMAAWEGLSLSVEFG